MSIRKHIVSLLASACLLGFAGAATAQATWGSPTLWDFGTPCNTPSCTAGGIQLTVSGFGNSGTNGAYQLGTVTNQGVNPGSGLGFTSKNANGSNEATSSSNHAFDNKGSTSQNPDHGSTNEVLLLDFGGAKVNLSALKTGWSTSDTDVMVFRWQGTLGAGQTMAQKMASINGPGGLIAAGWALVSAMDLDGSTTNWTTAAQDADRTFNLSGGKGWTDAEDKDRVSSYWLVSSYFGGASNGLTTSEEGGLDEHNDYFKLLSFTGSVCTSTVENGSCVTRRQGVPEPTSLALVALALAGFAGTARRRSSPKVR